MKSKNDTAEWFKIRISWAKADWRFFVLSELIKRDYNTPVRFSRPSAADFNPKGFSDYLPIELIIQER